MKTIIAGSRNIGDYELVIEAVELAKLLEGIEISEEVCGLARGIDTLGYKYAIEHQIPIKTFKPDYEEFGRYVAPKIRNTAMADYADALIAIWDCNSRGTADMIGKARNRNLRVFVFEIQ